jgi:hypothetical protein
MKESHNELHDDESMIFNQESFNQSELVEENTVEEGCVFEENIENGLETPLNNKPRTVETNRLDRDFLPD